jgi:uncharacterized protein YggE
VTDPTRDLPVARVSVTGTGRVERAADLARATFVVEGRRPSAADARSVAAGLANSVLVALGAVGIPAPDIRTAGIDVSPEWDHEGNRPVRKGFTVTNRIAVVIRDLELVGAVLDAGLEAGATGLDAVSFQLADSTADAAAARRLAVADARARAQTIAEAAGTTLGPLVAISEGTAAGPLGRPELRLTAMSDAAYAMTPVMPGAIEVTVTVTAEWTLAAAPG